MQKISITTMFGDTYNFTLTHSEETIKATIVNAGDLSSEMKSKLEHLAKLKAFKQLRGI